jgi:hypothetical protein
MSHNTEDGNESVQERNANDGKPGDKPAGKGRFFAGAISGVAAAVIAPLFTKQLRPVVRGAIKGGIVTGRYVRKVAEGVVEDFQDITAEAKAELAKEDTDKA